MDEDKPTETGDGRLRPVTQERCFLDERIISYYQPKIKQIIAARVRDRAMVDDLSQEVFIKIYHGLPGFAQRSKLSSWIYQITLNTLKNYYRDTAKFQHAEFDENYTGQDEQNDPLQCLMGGDLVDKMKHAASRLPKILWRCYYLSQFEGKTYEQISITMNCPVGTVRSRVHRARQLLKVYL